MYIHIVDDRADRRHDEVVERTLVLSVDDGGRNAVLRLVAEFSERLKVPVTVEDHRDRIEDLRSQLDVVEMGLLSQRGWKHTSSTPDCVWRWVKEFDDTTLMVDRRTALGMEGVHNG